MLEKIIQGGPLMIPLLICSVLALAAIFDRFIAFRANSKVDVRALRAEVLKLLAEGRDADALVLCANTPGPVAAVMLVGLKNYAKLKESNQHADSMRLIMAKAMDDYSVHAMSAVEKRFNVLSTVGNSAPLFGMTGTVTGMINSFDKLAGAGALDAGLVAGGISEALITTASGLLVALFAVIPLNLFTSMSERITLDIEEAASELVEFATSQANSKQA